jgi:hypothetical protein
MASLVVHQDELVVALSWLERVAAFRGNVHIPLGSIQSVSIQEAPYSSLRGIRAPGTGIPGVIAYGVRLMTGGRPDFAALHGRGPAILIELAPGASFATVLVTVGDPESTLAAVRAGLGDGGGI